VYTCYLDSLYLGLAVGIYLATLLTRRPCYSFVYEVDSPLEAIFIIDLHLALNLSHFWGSICFMETLSTPNTPLEAHTCHVRMLFTHIFMVSFHTKYSLGGPHVPHKDAFGTYFHWSTTLEKNKENIGALSQMLREYVPLPWAHLDGDCTCGIGHGHSYFIISLTCSWS